MELRDRIRSTLSAVRKAAPEQSGGGDVVERREEPPEQARMRRDARGDAAPEAGGHWGVDTPAQRERTAWVNAERAAHARAPVDAVLDPMGNPRAIEGFVTGPTTPPEEQQSFAASASLSGVSVGGGAGGGGGFEEFVTGGSGGEDGGADVDDDPLGFDDAFNAAGGKD